MHTQSVYIAVISATSNDGSVCHRSHAESRKQANSVQSDIHTTHRHAMLQPFHCTPFIRHMHVRLCAGVWLCMCHGFHAKQRTFYSCCPSTLCVAPRWQRHIMRWLRMLLAADCIIALAHTPENGNISSHLNWNHNINSGRWWLGTNIIDLFVI